MSGEKIHIHTAEEFRVFAVRSMKDYAVLQVKSAETGELFRFCLHVDHLGGLADQLKVDARLLKA